MITESDRNRLETYFDAMEKLFGTPGWKFHMDDLKGNLEALKNAMLGLSTIEQFYTAKGRYQVLTELLGFEDMLSKSREAYQDSKTEEASYDAI